MKHEQHCQYKFQHMLLLYGAPGSGKSTWVQRHGLTQLVVSFDRLRDMMTVPQFALDGDLCRVMRADIEQAAINATFTAAKARLNLGASVIVDATNLDRQSQQGWLELAQSYQIPIYLVDLQGDTSTEELLRRNDQRGIARVDAAVVRKLASLGRKKFCLPGIVPLSQEEALQLYTVPEIQLPDTAQIIVVGDIHSCATALQQVLAAAEGEHTHWIFLGDLFDRGPDPVGTFSQLEQLLAQAPDRVTLLLGNHDWYLLNLLRNQPVGEHAQTKATLAAFHEAGISAERLSALLQNMQPLAAFRFGGTSYLCTHGGISAACLAQIKQQDSYRSGIFAAHNYVYGTSSRKQTYQGRATYAHCDEQLVCADVIQLHGHRNGGFDDQPAPIGQVPAVINLEAKVETGGKLRAAKISAAGLEIIEVPELELPEPEPLPSLRWRLEQHPQVTPVATTVTHGETPVVSFEFAPNLYVSGKHREPLGIAQGLFMAGEQIVARGYPHIPSLQQPKLPNIPQLGTAEPALPAVVYYGESDFLALITQVAGQLVVFRDSGSKAAGALAKELLHEHLTAAQLAALVNILAKYEVTLVAEVIHDQLPQVLPEFGPNRLVLRDCIANQEAFAVIESALAAILAVTGGCLPQAQRQLITGQGQLAAAIQAAQQDETKIGVVIRFADGQLLRVYSNQYRQLKRLSTLVARFSAGARFTITSDLQPYWQVLESSGRLANLADFQLSATAGNQQAQIDFARLFSGLYFGTGK